eukprot:TRINITY_DN8497_c0_g1_i1.p1 TRINITY_DN8497_c0_g1~~TRINITY_DN8497_c0_g1_i1.p1  ORF type:complete len:224 (+),score=38.76 TRINITY_DN8497_c0_g1_i1:77-748(+)
MAAPDDLPPVDWRRTVAVEDPKALSFGVRFLSRPARLSVVRGLWALVLASCPEESILRVVQFLLPRRVKLTGAWEVQVAGHQPLQLRVMHVQQNGMLRGAVVPRADDGGGHKPAPIAGAQSKVDGQYDAVRETAQLTVPSSALVRQPGTWGPPPGPPAAPVPPPAPPFMAFPAPGPMPGLTPAQATFDLKVVGVAPSEVRMSGTWRGATPATTVTVTCGSTQS